MTDEGYRKIALADVPNTPNPTREKKEVDEALGVGAFGFNVYTADPGDQVPWGYHRHPDHEELFYVLAGELRVETPEGEYRVGPEEAFFVPADHLNRVVAGGDERARFIAVGAPKSADAAVIEEKCPACGEETDREYEVVEASGTGVATGDDEVEGGEAESDASGGREAYVLYCAECGVETRRFTG